MKLFPILCLVADSFVSHCKQLILFVKYAKAYGQQWPIIVILLWITYGTQGWTDESLVMPLFLTVQAYRLIPASCVSQWANTNEARSRRVSRWRNKLSHKSGNKSGNKSPLRWRKSQPFLGHPYPMLMYYVLWLMIWLCSVQTFILVVANGQKTFSSAIVNNTR